MQIYIYIYHVLCRFWNIANINYEYWFPHIYSDMKLKLNEKDISDIFLDDLSSLTNSMLFVEYIAIPNF